MDSDWCLFCEKHVLDLGAAYCSKDCAQKDKVMALAKASSSASGSLNAPSSHQSSSVKRLAHTPMTVMYTSMYRSSTLVPASMSSRGGISKGSSSCSGYSPVPAATTNIRCLPASRPRRQPLVL
ncbi:hypothetical protein DFQ27_009189 [Actinomortierella ambigua]|uniref:Uncharacterized protein n=1 Tax=Actinomortierella ambigua TaxID=1343610 RepID=A0A9P6QJL2_9FUNG|nr:hypothetical protein DFQ26_005257 [Actinomortierella ambigua]KAG0267043.1 hypothetical protein DFQ27_009189 [Actinomortierella ambigua]